MGKNLCLTNKKYILYYFFKNLSPFWAVSIYCIFWKSRETIYIHMASMNYFLINFHYFTVYFKFSHILCFWFFFSPHSHMYILFLLRVGLYVTKFYPEYQQGVKSWHKGLPVVKTIYTYGFQLSFLISQNAKHLATIT
jgi:hypothetical protein